MFDGSRRPHAHIKGGWPGQMRFKMAGKFKTTTSLRYEAAYIRTCKVHTRSVADEHSPRTRANAVVYYLSLHTLRKTREPDSARQENG